jgi:hypothetical protein
MLTFRDLWVPVCRRMADTSPGAMDNAKEYLNRIAREIAQRATWPHLCDERQFLTAAEYYAGHVSITKGTYDVTGDATVWTRDMANTTLVVGGADVRYKVRAWTSATALTLTEPYTDTAAVLAHYQLIADEYQLERDTIGVIRMNLPEEDRLLTPGEMHRYYEVRDSVEDSGCPTSYFHVGATQEAYYATGTVTATAGSTAVTGAGTAWDSTMVGRMIRFKDDMPRRMYRIASVAGVAALTLASAYRGLGGDNIEYEIDPAGIPLVKLYPRPDDAYHIYYYRKRAPKELFEDDETVSDWPEEFADTLIQGATYMALKEKGDSAGAGLEKMEYEKSLATRMASTAVTEPNIIRQVEQWGTGPRMSSFPGTYPSRLR